MKLKDLLIDVKVVFNNANDSIEVDELVMNSLNVSANCAFFAVRGKDNDGNNYVNDAYEKGASVVITETALPPTSPYVQVSDIRESLAIISANFYGNAHKKMKIIAIVGTNGKTTTSYMIKKLINSSGNKVAVFGTLGANLDGEVIDYGLTTPDPILLHKLIKQAYDKGIKHMVMEVSAHAIFYKKIAGIVADIAIFTNFSQDHLDFFTTMEEYANVKRSFFTFEHCRFAIVNADDELGRAIAKEGKIFLTTYGIESPSDTFAMDITNTANGTNFIVNCCDEICELSTNFFGAFNVYNMLSAIACARALSIDFQIIKNTFSIMTAVEGRFNILQSSKRVVIDFAHTPDGLKNLLTVARDMCAGRLITVFGCGGNRDALKRPIMGEIAGKLSDFTIITSDNSRYEAPMDIINAIESGLDKISNNYIKIAERENAITYAVLLAKPNDLVVIAGKGGENYIEENGIKKPYTDRKVVEETFRRYNL